MQTRNEVPAQFKKDLESKLNIHGQLHKPYVTAQGGGVGFFAVKLWWNPDGFWEPWDTGQLRTRTSKEAETEARIWAEAEGLEFRPYNQ